MFEVVGNCCVKNLVAAGRGVVAGEVPVADGMFWWFGGLVVVWLQAPSKIFCCLVNDFHLGFHAGRGEEPGNFGAVLFVGETCVKGGEGI